MGTNHGARQQKRAAKQKAKRLEKRSKLARASSNDPGIRLRGAAKWPVASAYCGTELWEQGIGSLVIARKASERELVFAVFLVDVLCLGVKNAFWRAGSPGEFRELIERLEESEPIGAIAPACLAKIVTGAIEYARSWDFQPHRDYRHASHLLDGIDPEACSHNFTFGKDGKPCYMRGPHESPAEANAIARRIGDAGGQVFDHVGDFFGPDELIYAGEDHQLEYLDEDRPLDEWR